MKNFESSKTQGSSCFESIAKDFFFHSSTVESGLVLPITDIATPQIFHQFWVGWCFRLLGRRSKRKRQ